MNLFERIVRKALSIVYKPIRFATLSYSQEGEDLILMTLMEEMPADYKGFYVDVGAHHPWRFSNTFLFYEKGWRGINIDATPGSMAIFHKQRSRDINLEVGVGLEPGKISFYCFNDHALNTFDRELALSRDNKYHYKLIKTVPVEVHTLASILDNHLPPDTNIDFLTIDVEGLDLMVLRSNNWQKYRPTYLLVEEPGYDDTRKDQVNEFMREHNYAVVARTQRTIFLKRMK